MSYVSRRLGRSITANSGCSEKIEGERKKKTPRLFNLGFCYREQRKHVQDLPLARASSYSTHRLRLETRCRSSQLHFQTSARYFIDDLVLYVPAILISSDANAINFSPELIFVTRNHFYNEFTRIFDEKKKFAIFSVEITEMSLSFANPYINNKV